jgi:hypothetical protein
MAGRVCDFGPYQSINARAPRRGGSGVFGSGPYGSTTARSLLSRTAKVHFWTACRPRRTHKGHRRTSSDPSDRPTIRPSDHPTIRPTRPSDHPTIRPTRPTRPTRPLRPLRPFRPLRVTLLTSAFAAVPSVPFRCATLFRYGTFGGPEGAAYPPVFHPSRCLSMGSQSDSGRAQALPPACDGIRTVQRKSELR